MGLSVPVFCHRGATLEFHPSASLPARALPVGLGHLAQVYLMHDVTLGATGTSEAHERHPKIGRGAFLAAKCTILGDIKIGAYAVVGAHSLVNKPVPPGHRAIGVPAKISPRRGMPSYSPAGAEMPSEYVTGRNI